MGCFNYKPFSQDGTLQSPTIQMDTRYWTLLLREGNIIHFGRFRFAGKFYLLATSTVYHRQQHRRMAGTLVYDLREQRLRVSSPEGCLRSIR